MDHLLLFTGTCLLGLCAEIKPHNHREDGQELLPGNLTYAGQSDESSGQCQRHDGFDVNKFCYLIFHVLFLSFFFQVTNPMVGNLNLLLDDRLCLLQLECTLNHRVVFVHLLFQLLNPVIGQLGGCQHTNESPECAAGQADERHHDVRGYLHVIYLIFPLFWILLQPFFYCWPPP